MSLKVMRVPLDFDWPIGSIWIGLILGYNIGPPKGNGYQMWEFGRFAAPISPVFETSEELTAWINSSFSGYEAEQYPIVA